MYYSVIKPCDIANGPGCRVVLFVSGCTHHCKGCFQPETWDFNYGQPFGPQTIEEILAALSPDYISGLTLLGGEPFEAQNQGALLTLLKQVRKIYPEKTVWAYSGYTYEQLLEPGLVPRVVTDTLLSYIDVLVDGEFVEERKDLSLRFRGSSNQRLIDLNKTREQDQIVLWDDKPECSMQ